jgi:NitT/TauT family transport system substrate-binding protein
LRLLLIIFVSFCLGSCANTNIKKVDFLRIGYLLNITHAVPMVGLEASSFSEVQESYFFAGGHLMDALLTNNVDLAYLGPGPYLNALHKGVKLRLLAVSAYGANSLILADHYNPDEIYEIKKIAVPQLGNTQDLLARLLVKRLRERNKHLEVFSKELKDVKKLEKIKISSNVEFIPVNPAELETAFYIKAVDSALVVEPWGTLLESKGLISVNIASRLASRSIVEELDSNKDTVVKDIMDYINKYPTTLLVTKEDFYQMNKERVDRFMQEQNKVLSEIKQNKKAAVALIKKHLETRTKKNFMEDFLMSSYLKVKFSDELDKKYLESLVEVAKDAKYFRREIQL